MRAACATAERALVALRHGDTGAVGERTSDGSPAQRGRLASSSTTSLSGATILSGKAITVDDWDNRPADQFPTSPIPRTTGIEVAGVPMLRDGVAVGSIVVSRPKRGGYTAAEVSLLQTFANQAAIAVENARLLREIEQRNAELAESLERQTAMSEVLDAVSTSRLDLTPVYDAVVRHADRLGGGTGALIVVRDGDELVVVAQAGPAARAIGDRFADRRLLAARPRGDDRRDDPRARLERGARRPLPERDRPRRGPQQLAGGADGAQRGHGRRRRLRR